LRERIAKQQIKETDTDVIKVITEKLAEIHVDVPPTQPVFPLESVTSEPIEIVQTKSIPLHSRNFRKYCNHFITQEIKQLTRLILQDLMKFQENKFQKNPVKAKANKRYVVGFKEAKKFLIVKRLKLVVIAPDLEPNAEVDALVEEIKLLADERNIPYVFGIKRREIGYLLLKKVPVSLVGIFDYQGTTENVNELLNYLQQEKINYKNKIQEVP